MKEIWLIVEHVLGELLDILSLSTLVATFLGWLPTMSLLLTVIWMALRIYESPTIQRHLIRDREEEDNAENLEERD